MRRRLALLVAVALLASGVSVAAAKGPRDVPASRAGDVVLQFGTTEPGYGRPIHEARTIPRRGTLGLVCRKFENRTCSAATGIYSDQQLAADRRTPAIMVTTFLGDWPSKRAWERDHRTPSAERVRVRGTSGYLDLSPWTSANLDWVETPNVYVSLHMYREPGSDTPLLSRTRIVTLARKLQRVPVAQLEPIPVDVGSRRTRLFNARPWPWHLVALRNANDTVCPGVDVGGLYFDECGRAPGAGGLTYEWIEVIDSPWLVGLTGPDVTRLVVDTGVGDPMAARVARHTGFRPGFFAVPVPPGTATADIAAFDRDGARLTGCAATPGEWFDGLRDC